MKVAVLATALISAAAVRADAAESVEEASASSAAESSTTIVPKPTFTPANIKAPFLEQFTDDWEKRWKPSNAKKENDKTSDEEWAYVGQWAVEEPETYPGMVGDKGLVVKNQAAHHAISAKFPKKIDNKGKDLVVQYEVKLQNGLECGGAYLKLLQDNKALHREEFSNASPYVIMFGPDRCGTTNKVHFIFRHKNPKTGEYEEKHMRDPPFVDTSKVTNVYTLIVRKDNTYEVQINGETKTSGSLLNDFTPAVNPDKEIDDPNDKKPEDWIDEPKMADPDAKKPEDWDEDAPYEIVDTEAVKPEDWLDDEPTTIPDPEAVKPEDWDDEEDGDWVPPTVSNPKCEEASGCGKWEPPMKKNPDYKGKWTAPFIDNPAYKGVWRPKQIKNPDYFEDKTPSNFEPMGAIGYEIWTMQNGILFDNIYIGHSIDDAIALKNQTYDLKIKAEKAQAEADKPKTPEPPKSPLDISFKEDPVTYVREKANLFWTIAQRDPIEAAKTVPEIAGGAALLLIAVLGALSSLLLGSSNVAAAKDKAKDAAKKVSDKTAEAVTTGAEKAQAEVTKRTTRSSQQ